MWTINLNKRPDVSDEITAARKRGLPAFIFDGLNGVTILQDGRVSHAQSAIPHRYTANMQ